MSRHIRNVRCERCGDVFCANNIAKHEAACGNAARAWETRIDVRVERKREKSAAGKSA